MNIDISVTWWVLDLKFSVCGLSVLSEGTVSQICHLGLSFHFYVKKRVTFWHFSKLFFLNFIKWKLGPTKKFWDTVPSKLPSWTCVANYKNFHRLSNEKSLFKKYQKKSEFSNSLFPLMGISQMICMYFIPLDRPQNQLSCGTNYVFMSLRGRYPSSIYCDHAKTALIDCCLSLSRSVRLPLPIY